MVLEMVGTSNFKAMQWHKYLLKAIFDTHFLTAILHRGLRNCFFFCSQTFHILFGLLYPFSIWTFTSLFYFPFLFGLLFFFIFQFFFNFFPTFFSIFFFYSIVITFWISSKFFIWRVFYKKSHSVWEATFMQKVGWIFAFRSAGPKIIYVLSVLKKEFDEWVHKRDMQRYIWQF